MKLFPDKGLEQTITKYVGVPKYSCDVSNIHVFLPQNDQMLNFCVGKCIVYRGVQFFKYIYLASLE